RYSQMATVSPIHLPLSSSSAGNWPPGLRSVYGGLRFSALSRSISLVGILRPFSARYMRIARGFGPNESYNCMVGFSPSGVVVKYPRTAATIQEAAPDVERTCGRANLERWPSPPPGVDYLPSARHNAVEDEPRVNPGRTHARATPQDHKGKITQEERDRSPGPWSRRKPCDFVHSAARR